MGIIESQNDKVRIRNLERENKKLKSGEEIVRLQNQVETEKTQERKSCWCP